MYYIPRFMTRMTGKLHREKTIPTAPCFSMTLFENKACHLILTFIHTNKRDTPLIQYT